MNRNNDVADGWERVEEADDRLPGVEMLAAVRSECGYVEATEDSRLIV